MQQHQHQHQQQHPNPGRHSTPLTIHQRIFPHIHVALVSSLLHSPSHPTVRITHSSLPSSLPPSLPRHPRPLQIRLPTATHRARPPPKLPLHLPRQRRNHSPLPPSLPSSLPGKQARSSPPNPTPNGSSSSWPSTKTPSSPASTKSKSPNSSRKPVS